MKTRLLVLAMAFFPAYLFAQVDLAYPVAQARGGAIMGIANDWEAIGINPANLGWQDNHRFSITLLNIGVNAQSDGLSIPLLRNLVQNKQDSNGSVYAHNILGHEKGLNLFADVNWMACSFRVAPLGGTFALSLRDRVVSNTALGPDGDQAFNGSDLSDAQVLSYLNGSTITLYHYREVNLAFGRELFEWNKGSMPSFTDNTVQGREYKEDSTKSSVVKIFGGVGVKYLMGMAYASMRDDNGMLYANYAVLNSYPSPALFPKAPGSGFATDIGLSALYQRWKFGLSFTDIGFIKWKQNYAAAADTNLSGLDQDYSNFVNGTVPEFQKTGNFKMGMPAKMRMGANYYINKHFSASSDFILPLNKSIANLPGPYISLAGQINLNRWLIFDMGFAEAQEYGLAMPAGISLGLGRSVHMYFGTNDVLTFMGKIHNPALSFAFGLIRVDIK